MRIVFSPQLSLGQVDIKDIQIDLSSRDDIPLIIRGLQHIFITPELKDKVFEILKEVKPFNSVDNDRVPVSSFTGRPGMSQWEILVLGSLRLGLNADYDRILELANQQITVRQMLGLGLLDDLNHYKLSTLQDNLRLLTPDILNRINLEVIKSGHDLLGLDPDSNLQGRCDSSVVKTDVHYPTDINLLSDAIHVITRECVALSNQFGLTGWRNYSTNLKKFKKLYRMAQTIKYSSSKNEDKRKLREQAVHQAYEALLTYSEELIERARLTLTRLNSMNEVFPFQTARLAEFIEQAERQVDQTRRRVLKGELIPHDEKVFSIFQIHTEWKSKGKAGVPVELGLPVCIIEDNHRFILGHTVMEKETDDKVAVQLVEAVQACFPNFNQCSFDKGFWSPQNFEELSERLDHVILPKKGRLSEKDKAREYSDDFIQARHQHSAVESAINALQVHGLDKCLDHGIDGFKKYVALGILSRNIQTLGSVLLRIEREKEKKRQKAA